MSENFRYLIYDIESVVDKNLLQRVLYPELQGDYEGAYQKHVAELAEEGRNFINPAFHIPVVIAVAAVNSDLELTKVGLLGKDDKKPRSLVTHFWETYLDFDPVLVDFNGKGFDLRLLELWAFRLGLNLGPQYFGKFGPRYRFSEEKHLDLHEFLTNYGAIRLRGGLNLFSKILGKPGKMETSGDKVQELFDRNKLFEIEDYCLSDTMDTYFVFLRTQVMRGAISLDQEKHLVEQARDHMVKMSEESGVFKEYLNHFEFWSPDQP